MAKNNESQLMTQVVSLASITADADTYGAFIPQKSRLKSAYVVNGASIAQDDTNKAVITLQLGATVLATHSTALTGGTSALTANVPAAMALSATDANLVIPAGSWLKVAYDESGTYAMTSAFVILNYFPL
jgi:hypothetical protein